MSAQKLQILLALPPGGGPRTDASDDEPRQAFRDATSKLNERLRMIAAHAGDDAYRTLDQQRNRLYEAFGVASSQTDPVRQRQALDRVLAAVETVGDRASATADEVEASRQRWLDLEVAFDDALAKIAELEESGHAKAAALRAVGQAILDRVNSGQYQQAVTALDRLTPTLDRYCAERTEQQPRREPQPQSRAAAQPAADANAAEDNGATLTDDAGSPSGESCPGSKTAAPQDDPAETAAADVEANEQSNWNLADELAAIEEAVRELLRNHNLAA